MVRPVLRLKPKTRPADAAGCPHCDGWLMYQIATDKTVCVKCGHEAQPETAPDPFTPPAHWVKGQLLNVKRYGNNYIATTLEEDFDSQHPERAMIFDSPYTANEFLSAWYRREAGR